MAEAVLRPEIRPTEGLGAVLASISDGFIAVDNDWRFTYLNPAAERVWRLKAADLIGRGMFETVLSRPGSPFEATYRESKRSGDPVTFSARSAVIDGAWMEMRGYPHADGYAVFFREVTAARQMHLAALEREREVEQAKAINQRIFDTSLDLILVTDREGNLLRVSPSSLAILGYGPAEMETRSAQLFVYADDLDNTRNEMRLGRRGQAMRMFDCRYVHRDGHAVPLAWTGVWSQPEQRHFFIGRDMTERIAAEERLRRAQRLEAVGQLTGGIAHDFNNLLTVAIGNLDLLQDKVASDAEASGYTGAALRAALRGAELTRQLLAFSRRQSLDARVLALNERVSATMDLLRRTLGEDIEIATQLADDLWPAFADPAQFESALVNLAINARDAMQGGGRLTIETHNARLDETYVRENIDATLGDYVMLAVSDTGTGMPPEVLARVFEPFFTTKPTGQGTGLGLSMVYGFARQSHGHVKIYSEVGHGTTVRLYLPRAGAGGPRAVDEAAPATLPLARPGERVLVVEDNADVRAVVVAQLSELGYQVAEAAHGDAALQILRRGEPFDLLFSDVVMPGGMSGDELARAAHELRPRLKLLLTSGFAKSSMQNGPRSETFRNLLSKPYRKVDLAAKLRAVLDGGA